MYYKCPMHENYCKSEKLDPNKSLVLHMKRYSSYTPSETEAATLFPEEYVCPNCNEWMEEPMQCEQGYTMCRLCWRDSPSGVYRCPIGDARPLTKLYH